LTPCAIPATHLLLKICERNNRSSVCWIHSRRCSSAIKFSPVSLTSAHFPRSHALEAAVEEHESPDLDLLNLHVQAVSFFPTNPEVPNVSRISFCFLKSVVQLLYATSRLQKVAGLFHDSLINAEAALSLKPSLPCIENHIESLKNAIVSRWHFAMLNDKGILLLCIP
jgi:hypothetical protein